MRAAHQTSWPEQEIVHRLFSIRWTQGCLFTRFHGQLEDSGAQRPEMANWSRALNEIIPQTGQAHVSLLDTSALSEVPRSMWLELAKIVHDLPRGPIRRAIVTADGWRGDNQAQVGQLVTAGHVRIFNSHESSSMIRWSAGGGTIDEYRLRAFLR